MRVLPLLAVLLVAAPAGASMDKTLDISAHGVRLNTAAFDANGLSLRGGYTFGPMRFGSVLNAYGPELRCECAPGTRASMLGLESFVGYAPNGYWEIRPFVELRAHAERLRVGDDSKLGVGFGPRIGVLFPLSEYFFFDLGIGRDIVGPETLRATAGIGLPIPLSHL